MVYAREGAVVCAIRDRGMGIGQNRFESSKAGALWRPRIERRGVPPHDQIFFKRKELREWHPASA
jgi:hypothetical protein